MSKFSKSDLVLMVLAAIYVLMPVDLIPELITGPLGLTDDMAAMALIMATVMRARGREPEQAVVPATVTYER